MTRGGLRAAPSSSSACARRRTSSPDRRLLFTLARVERVTTTQDVSEALAGLGVEELRRRQGEATRLIDQDGVVYRDASGPRGGRRRWRLDPMPVVLDSGAWAEIESGIIERAELLDLVLTDLYGPRELLRRHLIPPEVVLGHPGFLHACDGIRLPGEHQLFNYAADLGRCEDGRLVVLADRTQAPSGSGYAMENRLVCQRVLPTLYRDAGVHRLAPFFRWLRSALQAAAPPDVEDPRIVVLSPGPYNETAFEHAVLASTLGYPLVEGSDLTVRGGSVWMRSLGQREPVHVILRRVDDTYCDPLELNPESQLGVTGLVQATRAGTVSVVNALGSGVLENPALAAFEEAVARHLLGRPLRLPAVPSWWCGDPVARAYVLEHLSELVLRPTSPIRGNGSVFGWEASSAELEELRARIEARPAGWVGQAAATTESAPTLTGDGIELRRSVLRAFAIPRGSSYVVMPGGLTRVAPTAAAGASRRRPAREQGHLGARVRARAPDGLLAAERAGDAGARSRRAHPVSRRGEPLVARALRGARGGGHAAPAGRPGPAQRVRGGDERGRRLRAARPAGGDDARDRDAARLHRRRRPDAPRRARVTSCARSSSTTRARARSPTPRAGSSPRPRRCATSCRATRGSSSGTSTACSSGTSASRRRRSRRSCRASWRSSGLFEESMERDLGWRHMDAGRRLERSLQVLALLRATVGEAHDTATDSLLLESVLTAAESIITYRRRYRSQAQLETLLDLLLVDEDNPRSVGHGLVRLADDLDAMPPGADGRLREDQRHLLRVSTALRLCETASLAETDDHGRRHALEALLAGLADGAAADRGGRRARPRHPPAAAALAADDMTTYRVTHRTEYEYEEDVAASHSRLHLLPRDGPAQTCVSTEIASLPLAGDYSEHTDFFGNRVGYLAIHETHRTLDITATSVVEVDEGEREPSLFGERPWEAVRDAVWRDGRPDAVDAMPFALDSPLVAASDALRAYAEPSFPPGRALLDAVLDLSSRIHADFAYEPGATEVGTTLEEVLVERKGVCQDFAHVGIGCLRSARAPGPLRQRLPGDRPASRAAEAGRRRRLPCLVLRAPPGGGLARRRPDERPARQQPLRRRRVRSRLPRRAPDQRRHLHRGLEQHVDGEGRRLRGMTAGCAPSSVTTAACCSSSRTASVCAAVPRRASCPRGSTSPLSSRGRTTSASSAAAPTRSSRSATGCWSPASRACSASPVG